MILVLNAGSSSLKVMLFNPALDPVFAAQVSEIGGASHLGKTAVTAPNHQSALALILRAMTDAGHPATTVTVAAHRVVHGGTTLTAPARLTPSIIAQITDAVPLAPLHNPANLAGIYAMSEIAPGLPQFASFDTAFHATNPDVATAYALPFAERAKGLRRYGFHGLSYASLIHQITPLPARLLAFHLGNGCSLCAIYNGVSVATSMGYSPLEGLVMGTRTGAIDGMAVLRLAQDHGIATAADILNRQSGLKALTGTNDMRTILLRDDDDARFAVELFCYWAIRQGGSAIAAMGGLDAVAFTGGIGENATVIRDRIMAGLAFLGPVPVHVIKAEEERQIARDALSLLRP